MKVEIDIMKVEGHIKKIEMKEYNDIDYEEEERARKYWDGAKSEMLELKEILEKEQKDIEKEKEETRKYWKGEKSEKQQWKEILKKEKKTQKKKRKRLGEIVKQKNQKTEKIARLLLMDHVQLAWMIKKKILKEEMKKQMKKQMKGQKLLKLKRKGIRTEFERLEGI